MLPFLQAICLFEAVLTAQVRLRLDRKGPGLEPPTTQKLLSPLRNED